MNRSELGGDLTIGIRFFFITFLVLGCIYPLSITFIGNHFFRDLSQGSLILGKKGEIKGSYLIAQKFDSGKYFLTRPSASSFASVPSGASQLAPSSSVLHQLVSERKADLKRRAIDPEKCKELLYASGSGLDPHITTQCALEQVRFVSENRKLEPEKILKIIGELEEKSFFGLFGRDRINVMEANVLLDRIDSSTL